MPFASGETALMRAARAGDLARRRAPGARRDVNLREQTRGQTAVLGAVANRQPSIVGRLIARGADVKVQSEVTPADLHDMGGTLLPAPATRGNDHAPAFAGWQRRCSSRRAQVTSESSSTAPRSGHEKVERSGRRRRNPVLLVAICTAAMRRSRTCLIDQGADVNAAPTGYAAVSMQAVLSGTLHENIPNADPMAGAPLVAKLLERGAKPDVRVEKGTPLRRWSHDFVLHENWLGATAYWLAAKFLEVDAMRALKAAGAESQHPQRRRHDAVDGGGGPRL